MLFYGYYTGKRKLYALVAVCAIGIYTGSPGNSSIVIYRYWEFLADMEILYRWMTTGQERKESTLAEKILRVYSGWELVHSKEVLDMTHTSPYEIDAVPVQIRYLTYLREFVIRSQQITDLPDELA